MEYFRGLPFPIAVAALFVIVLLRAGATYGLGRAAHLGAERTRLQRLVASPRFARAERMVDRYGAPLVALSFLTVGFQTLANLAAGVARMPLRRYGPALLVGGLAWALLYASVGLLTLTVLVELWQRSPVLAVAATVLVVGAVAAYVVVQRRRAQGEEPAAPPTSVGV